MDTTKLAQAHQSLIEAKNNIVGQCETVARIHKEMHERVAEVDEHAARVGAFVYQQRQIAAEMPQQQEALAQVRSDAKAGLGPLFARDLWRELVETCQSIGCEPSANEREVYLAAVGWLFDRPLNDAPAIELGNCIPLLDTAKLLAEIFNPLAILFELDKPKVELASEDHRVVIADEVAANPPATFNPGEVVGVGTPDEPAIREPDSIEAEHAESLEHG